MARKRKDYKTELQDAMLERVKDHLLESKHPLLWALEVRDDEENDIEVRATQNKLLAQHLVGKDRQQVEHSGEVKGTITVEDVTPALQQVRDLVKLPSTNIIEDGEVVDAEYDEPTD